MALISIGKTTSGVAIFIETDARQSADTEPLFTNFSERDRFDALMAIEYLAVSELRRNFDDEPWLNAIGYAHVILEMALGNQTIAIWSERLGLTSAFAARDYGKSLIHRHFRYL